MKQRAKIQIMCEVVLEQYPMFTVDEVRKFYRSYCKQIVNTRFRAKTKDIKFNMNFYEWWVIWASSGHIRNMGKYKGQYVMARHNDSGDYAPDNVSIITISENTVAAHKGRKHSEEAKAKIGAAHKGKTVSEATRAKIVATSVRDALSAETLARMSAASKGRIPNEATRAKMSAAQKQRYIKAKQHTAKVLEEV